MGTLRRLAWAVSLVLVALTVVVFPAFAAVDACATQQPSPVSGATAREVFRYGFGANTYDGTTPAGALVADAAGSFYGLTTGGGQYFSGTAFALKSVRSGYREAIIFNFGGSAGSDLSPVGALLSDGTGNFFGVTTVGGFEQEGAVFALSPGPSGYTETVIYNFPPYTVNNIDYPPAPNGSLVRDASGALYGTTAGGGTGPPPGNGTVFKLTPSSSGYTETTLYAFGTDPSDGVVPRSGLTIDASGALYGTALNGGAYHNGTVFKLTPGPSGYRERTLHAFGAVSADGNFPFAGVTLDRTGAIFGTTLTGGIRDHGVVFALTPVRGMYHEIVLHRFEGNLNGYAPYGGLIVGPNGTLFGTAEVSGSDGGGNGTAFELRPAANGCRELVLHRFGGSTDGADPMSPLVLDAIGNIWGTTPAGGIHANGTAFELTQVP